MHMPAEISRFVAQAFVAGLWQGLALVSAVALLLRFVPRLSAAARYAIWWFAFALAAAIPLLHLPFSAVLPVHAASAVVHVGAEWGFAIAAVWAGLMVGRGAQLLTHAITLHRIWKRATPVAADSAVKAILHGGPRAAELCTSEDVDAPSVIGFFSPRLLIPEWLFATLAPAELEQIVLHECEHLRRHDDWVNLLQKVGLVLFPLNPALLWMDRRLSLERELACDAGVVASTKAPFDYARCLTQLAEHRLLRRSVALSLSAWSRQSELARRVHNLLGPASSMPRARARFSAAAICAGLILGAMGMAGSPHLLAFTDSATPPTPVLQATDTVAFPEGGRAVPVMYRPATQPHPVLLKAVATPRKARHARHHSNPANAVIPVRNLRATNDPTQVTRPQPQMVLTTFEVREERQDNAGPVSVQFTEVSTSYAAVAFARGWLVIQL
jgi:beta-lactamase regulating signal transducer with metallopeptidase domain